MPHAVPIRQEYMLTALNLARLFGENTRLQKEIAALRAKLAEYESAPTVATVKTEPDYWYRGHFHEGKHPWISQYDLSGVAIGTELIARPARKGGECGSGKAEGKP